MQNRGLTLEAKKRLIKNKVELIAIQLSENQFAAAKTEAILLSALCNEVNDVANSQRAETYICICDFNECLSEVKDTTTIVKELTDYKAIVTRLLGQCEDTTEIHTVVMDTTDLATLAGNETTSVRSLLIKLEIDIDKAIVVKSTDVLEASVKSATEAGKYLDALKDITKYIINNGDCLETNTVAIFPIIIKLINLTTTTFSAGMQHYTFTTSESKEFYKHACGILALFTTETFKEIIEAKKEEFKKLYTDAFRKKLADTIETLKQANDISRLLRVYTSIQQIKDIVGPEIFDLSRRSILLIGRNILLGKVNNLSSLTGSELTQEIKALDAQSDEFITAIKSFINESSLAAIEKILIDTHQMTVSSSHRMTAMRPTLISLSQDKSPEATTRFVEEYTYRNARRMKLLAELILAKQSELEAFKNDEHNKLQLFILYSQALAYYLMSPSAEDLRNYNYCLKNALAVLSKRKALLGSEVDEQADYVKQLTDNILSSHTQFILEHNIFEAMQQYSKAHEEHNHEGVIVSIKALINLGKASLGYACTNLIPAQPRLLTELGDAYVSLTKFAIAKDLYETALLMDPTYIPARIALTAELTRERVDSSSRKRDIQDERIAGLRAEKPNSKYIDVELMMQQVLNGDPQAYYIFKSLPENIFADKPKFIKFAELFYQLTPEQLKSQNSNVLYDVAQNILTGIIQPPSQPVKYTYVIQLLELAAEKGMALAMYKLGCVYLSLFEFKKSKHSYIRALASGHKDARLSLVLAYHRDGEYDEAKVLLDGLQKDSAFTEHAYLNHLVSVNKSLHEMANAAPNTPAVTTETTRRVVYFDFDNTLMRAIELPGTFYKLYYQDGQPPAPQVVLDNLVQFYTGSRDAWREIFNKLRDDGFTIGICTARFAESKDQCPLFKQFMKDFGRYIHPNYILFTRHKCKYTPMLDSCQANGISRKHAVLVDDQKNNTDEVTANGFKSIHVPNLVTAPDSFDAFTKHLFKMTDEIVRSCQVSTREELTEGNDDYVPEVPGTPSYSTENASVAPIVRPATIVPPPSPDVIDEVVEEGAAPLVQLPARPAATLTLRSSRSTPITDDSSDESGEIDTVRSGKRLTIEDWHFKKKKHKLSNSMPIPTAALPHKKRSEPEAARPPVVRMAPRK